MRFFYGVLIVLFGMLMQSCASTRHAVAMAEGRIYFQDGNFKEAFKKLLPAAADGDAKAQYAVGYMYYYGYGVTQDRQSGLFWIERSASKNYMPAIAALKVTNGVSTPPAPSCPANSYTRKQVQREEAQREVIYYKDDPASKPAVTSDEVLRSIPHVEQKKIITPPPAKKMVRTEGYGLQLFGAYELADVKQLQKKLSAQKTTTIWHAENKGKDWYVLIYQQYPTMADAKVAKNKMPENLSEMRPWVRNLSTLG